MVEYELSEDEWELVKYRILQSMPPTVKLSIGNVGSLSRDEIIQHIEERDKIGAMIVRMQMNLIKSFKKDVIE